MVPVVCALGAALLYAAASVLQQRAAAAEPADRSMRLALLVTLLRRPGWLLGMLADVAAFVLQVIALQQGTLVIVQPLLVTGLLFALPIGAWASGERVGRSDLGAALAVCAGLAAFLTVARPEPGHDFISGLAWIALLAAGGGLAAGLAGAGRVAVGRARALLLSGCTGVLYGLAAGLVKTTAQLFADHAVGALAHWQPYALALVGLAGLVIGQSAFQAGSLDVSLPTMSVVDPVVSVMVGALAFGEGISAGPLDLLAEVAGLIVTVGGVFMLARSPAVRAVHEHPEA